VPALRIPSLVFGLRSAFAVSSKERDRQTRRSTHLPGDVPLELVRRADVGAGLPCTGGAGRRIAHRVDDDDAGGVQLRFKGSPIKRTKRRGLLRNVAVALGDWGAPEAVPALAAALDDEEALVRGTRRGRWAASGRRRQRRRWRDTRTWRTHVGAGGDSGGTRSRGDLDRTLESAWSVERRQPGNRAG
jgi:hypothetical protein